MTDTTLNYYNNNAEAFIQGTIAVDFSDIRWNACKILFNLKQRFKDSNLIDRILYELMDDDCVYIKYLILDHLDDISIDEKIKDEIILK